jgi:hypothetical protein
VRSPLPFTLFQPNPDRRKTAPILNWRRSSGYHHPHGRERRVLVRVIRSRPFWSVLPLDALNPVMMLRGGSCYETNGYAGEAIFQFRRRPAETNLRFDGFTNNGVLPMWKIINALYREYCLARLNEMRRLELNC